MENGSGGSKPSPGVLQGVNRPGGRETMMEEVTEGKFLQLQIMDQFPKMVS